MKAIISTTYSDTYLFYLPITTWLWNKIGVDVICFMPFDNRSGNRFMLVSATLSKQQMGGTIYNFDCPENKEATYAQCSRLYAAALNLPEDEILVTSDIDMGVFKNFPSDNKLFCVFGSDLVPEKQYPMCYVTGTAKTWCNAFGLNGKSYQNCLDELLGDIDCENMRGNYWGKDQEEMYNKVSPVAILHKRAKEGTQFATNRIDRDDSYFMDRLSPDVIDYHMHRPGYTEENFEKILAVISYFYPHDDLTWIREYQQEYKKLL